MSIFSSLHCDNDVTYAKSLDFLIKDRANIRKILFTAKISDFLTQPFFANIGSFSTQISKSKTQITHFKRTQIRGCVID